MFIGGGVIALMVILAAVAPLFAGNALAMDPMHRLRPRSRCIGSAPTIWGATCLRVTVYGARVSLFVGLSVAVAALAGGLVIGLLCGFYRRVDAVLMRLMDGVMAIPSILLAIAMVSLFQGGVPIVILAILYRRFRATCGWCAPSCWACANSHS